jgi:Ca-activated chloride channel family protein
MRRRRRVADAIGERALVHRLLGADLHAVPWARVVAMLLAATALGLAVAGRGWGAAAEARRATGDVVLVLDASNSMLAEDAAGAPDRLEAERHAALEIARALRGTPVGVVAFAGRAWILTPPTADFGAVEMYLETLSPEMVTQTGSSLAAALRQGIALLATRGDASRGGTIVLISDGDALEPRDSVLAAARLAARAGFVVHTLGAGTPAGAQVPDIDWATGRRRGYKTDPETGRTAVSRLDEPLLREIASASGGTAARLSDARAVDRLVARLPAGAGGAPRAGTLGYEWPLGLALLLLAGDAVGERRIRREPI